MRPDSSSPATQCRLKLVESSATIAQQQVPFCPDACIDDSGEGMAIAQGQLVFESFIQKRIYLKNVSPRTVDWYRESFKWLGKQDPTQEDLDNFVVRMRKHGLTPASCNNRIRAVRAYLKWRNLKLQLSYMREEEKPLAIYNKEAIRRLIAMRPSPKQRRTHTLMLLMFDVGLRIAECIRLQGADVDFDNMLIGVRGKGRKHRFVPISQKMASVLKRFSKGAGPIFQTKSGRPLSARNALRDVKRLCKSLGFQAPPRSIHAIRHTMATEYIRHGGSVVKLQRILGHKSIKTTMRYVHLQGDDLVEEHERIGILGSEGRLRKTEPNLQLVDSEQGAPRKFPLTSVSPRIKFASVKGQVSKS